MFGTTAVVCGVKYFPQTARDKIPRRLFPAEYTAPFFQCALYDVVIEIITHGAGKTVGDFPQSAYLTVRSVLIHVQKIVFRADIFADGFGKKPLLVRI